MLRVRAYTEADAERWDAFCGAAHGATFLHTRRFLSYHGDRFVDRSLIVEDGDAWLGVLPAAQSPSARDQVVSHPGITYGGLIDGGALRGEGVLHALRAAQRHYAALGYRTLLYKAVPHPYHRAPAQDDLYALFRLDARRVRCELASCLALAHPLPASARRRRGAAKAQRAGLRYASGASHAAELWQVLEHNLRSRHGSGPVHTLDEILQLSLRFPDHIAFHVALQGDRVVAGVVSFRSADVMHLQYIAASEPGHAVSALDGLLQDLIAQARSGGCRYFDFGTSNEDHGQVLNEGLHRFKTEFGAGGVACETYALELGRQTPAYPADRPRTPL